MTRCHDKILHILNPAENRNLDVCIGEKIRKISNDMDILERRANLTTSLAMATVSS